MPAGTDVKYTDSVTRQLEARVNHVLGIDPAHNKTNPIVESIISNVAVGAAEPNSGSMGAKETIG